MPPREKHLRNGQQYDTQVNLPLQERLLPYFVVLGATTLVGGTAAYTTYERREGKPTTLHILRTETYQGPEFSIHGGTHWVAITPAGALELRLNTYARLNGGGGMYCVTTRKSSSGPMVARLLNSGPCQRRDQ